MNPFVALGASLSMSDDKTAEGTEEVERRPFVGLFARAAHPAPYTMQSAAGQDKLHSAEQVLGLASAVRGLTRRCSRLRRSVWALRLVRASVADVDSVRSTVPHVLATGACVQCASRGGGLWVTPQLMARWQEASLTAEDADKKKKKKVSAAPVPPMSPLTPARFLAEEEEEGRQAVRRRARHPGCAVAGHPSGALTERSRLPDATSTASAEQRPTHGPASQPALELLGETAAPVLLG